ncbi:MAG: sulfite exporter TauE/SafE family protein [Syntrophales bacterium]
MCHECSFIYTAGVGCRNSQRAHRLGGGTIIVPVLVLFFGMSQHLAQGTTLALLVPPVGILATWQYYKRVLRGFSWGRPHMPWLLNRRPGTTLEKIFGAALLLISLKMTFGK